LIFEAEEVAQPIHVETLVKITACGVEDLTDPTSYGLSTYEQMVRKRAFINTLMTHKKIEFTIDLNKTEVFVGDLIHVKSNEGEGSYRITSMGFPQKVLHGQKA